MSETTHLTLPYIAASQAQKHVTHNEALRMLDALVMLSVKDRDLSVPPGSPVDGDRYLVNPAGSGGFSGKDNQIAHYRDGAWAFYMPQSGWLCYVEDEELPLVYDGAAWAGLLGENAAFQNVSLLGVGTAADGTNPFAAKLNNVLWTARYDGEGGDGNLRYKLNKEDAADTLSMLFQTGFSGRAEVGLIGDDKLRVKVSADGSDWTEALVVDNTNGWVGIGIAAPEAPLHLVLADSTQPRVDMYVDATNAPGFRSHKARGTPSSPVIVNNGDNVGTFPMAAWDGSTFLSAGLFRYTVDGAPSAGDVPTRVEFLTRTAAGSVTVKLIVDNAGATKPGADNAYTCGASGARWSAVWSANGTIQTSDGRLKNEIADSALGLDFINALRPVSYRWISGGNDVVVDPEGEPDEVGNPATRTVPRPGTRTHYGLIAQEVKAALDAAGVGDFGGYIKTNPADPDSDEGLRYDQFIAPLIRAVQELSARVEALEQQSQQE